MSLFRRLTHSSSPSSSSTNVSSSAPSVQTIATNNERRQNVSQENDIFRACKQHCKSIKDILLTRDTSKCTPEECRCVMDNFAVVINIISDENSGQDGQLGECLEYAIECGIFDEIFSWSLSQRTSMKELIKEQLKLYKSLLKRCRQPILIFEEIVVPMKRLLRSCIGKQTSDIELFFVEILHQLCICVNQDATLLDSYFIMSCTSNTDTSSSVFSSLVPYVHREGQVGSKSRDAVLLCTSLSTFQEKFAYFICEETTFCPVLATGLSALYSRLPNTLDVPGEDWYCLEKGLWTTLPELKSFITSLEFCNDVIQTAHPQIQSKLLDLIYQGFLVSVMAPALNQNSSDALTAATAYFDLFLGSITEPKLMKVFLKFILQEKSDEVPILHSLLQRIETRDELCLVTLALFQTLINLNSEDVMIELVLSYLLPCNHVMGSQRKMIQEIDLYGKVAVRFLTLIPSCCYPNLVANEEYVASENLEEDERENRDSENDLFDDLSLNFLAYLVDARKNLSDRRTACSCWSALWDGLEPSYEPIGASNRLSNGSVVYTSTSSPEVSSITKETEQKRSVGVENDVMETVLGPFISKLFKKLEKMPENSIATNEVLTRIISSLAEYSQPLLRSFLLNHSLVLQPHVKSIFQILNTVKAKLETNLNQFDDLEQPFLLAKRNLIQREETRRRSLSRRTSQPSSPESSKIVSRQSSTNSPSRVQTPSVPSPYRNTFVEKRNDIYGDDTSETLSMEEDLENAIEKASSWILLNLGPKGISRERTRAKHINMIKNTVYCAVLMEEWLKELAAISLEHSVQPYDHINMKDIDNSL